MSDYTTKATVELDVNGQKAKQELELQRKLVKDLEIAYAKAEATGDKSAKTIHKELNRARRELKLMQSATVNVADVLRRLDKATPKELKATLKQLNKELNNLPRGSEAWNTHVAKIRAVKKELESVNSTLATQRTGWQKLGDFINKWQTMAVAAFAVVMKVVSAGRNAVNAYASIDQEMANTQKFTGLTREAVELLNEEFKKMDTRTGREGLNKLAQSAGRLGKDSIKDVLDFVRAGDKISVAMDELGEDAPEIISKLSGIFNLETEMGTEKAMLSTGSAVNTLSQVCAASAPNLVDFSSRFGAIASSSNMAISEMLAFGAVLDSNGVTMEKGATAMQGVVTRMYAEPSKFAKIANLDAKEFTETLKRSSTEGLMMFIDRLSQMDQMQMSATLKELGTAGAGVTQTFQTLANKSEELKTRMQQSNKAFREAISVDEEFAIQNNTVQAGLDKAKEKFRELQRELGQKLAPVMQYVISSTGAIVRILIEVISFVGKYKGELAVLTAAIVAYNVAVNVATIKTKLYAVAQGVAKVATVAWTAVTYLSVAAMALFTGNVTRATIAFKAFSTTLKVSSIGLLVAGITAVVGGLALWILRSKQLTTVQKAVEDATTKSNSVLFDEKAKIQSLIFVAENERISMEKRIEAVNKLNAIIPRYNAQIDKTTGKYTASKKALDDYINSLEKRIKYEANVEKLRELISVHEQAINNRDALDLELEDSRKTISNKIPIRTSGHAATGASQQELFELYAAARRKEADKAITDAFNDVEEFKIRMNVRIEKGEISPETEEESTKCPKCKKSPCICSKVDAKTAEDKFKAENEWKEREDALNRIAYATGEKDYDEYTRRIDQISVDFYKKQLDHTDLSAQERLSITADYYDAIAKMQKKAEQKSCEDAINAENNKYNEKVSLEKQRYLDGKISLETYNNTIETLELEHLKNIRDIYEKQVNAPLEEWKKARAEAENEMREFYQGNVDLMNRPQIDASKLKEKGWEDAGEGVATVFSSQYGILDADGNVREILVTPILPDGTVLSETELQDYIHNVLEGSNDVLADDNKGIVISVDVAPDGTAGDRLHQLQELFYSSAPDVSNSQFASQYADASSKYSSAVTADQLRRKQQTDDAKARFKADFFGDNFSEQSSKYKIDLALLQEVYNAEMLAAGNNADEKLRIEEAFQKAKLALAQKYNLLSIDDNRNALEKANAELAEWLESDAGKAVTQSFDTVMSGMGAIFSQVSSLVQAELEMQTAEIEKRYDKEISLAEGNSYKVAQLEKQKEKEIAKAKKEANRKMFAMQVIQAVAQTATNAINAYGSAAAIPVVGFVMAPIAAAMAIAAGALQIAAIKKQQQASEAQGYSKGGFTPPGAVDEAVGVVHAGEWVASQKLLANPVARPLINALDYAQRTNTIGSLKADDVSRTISAPTRIASANESNGMLVVLNSTSLALSNYADSMRKLKDRLNEPFITVNTITGDTGIKKAQEDYDKLMRNKTPKSKRK